MKTNNMLTNIVLIITTMITALIAGLYYSWSCAVIPGLSHVADTTYVETMQQINRSILNPIFFLSFAGTAFLLPLSTYLHYGQPMRFWLLLIASAIYIIGSFGVTIAGNVPLNDALDNFQLSTASIQEITTQRIRFEKPWNNFHTVRTLATIISLVLVIIACISPTVPIIQDGQTK